MSIEDEMNYVGNNSFDDSNDYVPSCCLAETKNEPYNIPLEYIYDIINSTTNTSNVDEHKLKQAVEKNFSQNTMSNNFEIKENDDLNQNEENIQLTKNHGGDSDENILNKKTSRKNSKDKKIKKIFSIQKNKNRGRKSHESERKTHNKYYDDNLITKIQVHFLTFLIYFTNDVLKTGQIKDDNGNYISFLQINYDDKKNISLDYFEKLKSYSIKDILQKEISPKYEKNRKDYNKNIYNYISNKISKDKSLSWIKKYFDMNYLKAYENFYLKTKNVIFQGKEINCSEKTKSFDDLLKKNGERMEECLKRISTIYSSREKIPSKKIFFVTKEK